MKKPNLASEVFLFACGLLPLGAIAAFEWITKGKVSRVFGYGVLALFVAFFIAGIEERIEARRECAKELKEHDE